MTKMLPTRNISLGRFGCQFLLTLTVVILLAAGMWVDLPLALQGSSWQAPAPKYLSRSHVTRKSIFSTTARSGVNCSAKVAAIALASQDRRHSKAAVKPILLTGGHTKDDQFWDTLPSLTPANQATEHLYLRDPANSCIVFAFTRGVDMELPFVLQRLMNRLPDMCGCRIQLTPRARFVHIFENWDTTSGICARQAMLLVGVFGPSAEEMEAMRKRPQLAKSKVIVLFMSDEKEKQSIDSYPLVRMSYRQYHSKDPARGGSLQYLLRDWPSKSKVVVTSQESGGTNSDFIDGLSVGEFTNAGIRFSQEDEEYLDGIASDAQLEPQGSVLFLPLGYAYKFMATPSLDRDLPLRHIGWSFTGSVSGGRPDRIKFIDALKNTNNSQIQWVNDHGVCRSVGKFDGPDMLDIRYYSTILYSSQIVVCPPGGSPEQFRIWETLEAGAVPLLNPGDRNLEYILSFGFRVVEFRDSWDKAPQVIYKVLNEQQEELFDMQRRNRVVYRRLISRLQIHFARHMCAAVEF